MSNCLLLYHFFDVVAGHRAAVPRCDDGVAVRGRLRDLLQDLRWLPGAREAQFGGEQNSGPCWIDLYLALAALGVQQVKLWLLFPTWLYTRLWLENWLCTLVVSADCGCKHLS